MTIQFDNVVHNARLDAIETAIGVSPTLKIRTGAPPANCATADSGVVLDSIALPADWMGNAASNLKSLLGTWAAAAIAAGTAGHFRIYDSGGTCRMQGTVTATGGGGDMTVDNAILALAQAFSVTSFALADGNV